MRRQERGSPRPSLAASRAKVQWHGGRPFDQAVHVSETSETRRVALFNSGPEFIEAFRVALEAAIGASGIVADVAAVNKTSPQRHEG